MKRLNFSLKNEQATLFYEMIYDGIINSQRGFSAPSETRVIGSLLNKLEAIGKVAERGGQATYTLNYGGVIEIEEEVHKLASDALRHVKWSAAASRNATTAIDWFDNAPAAMTDNGVDKETIIAEAK